MDLLTLELPFELRFQSLAYIVAALLFILALAGLSKQTTAQRGNRLGMIGMVLALLATVWVVIAHAGDNTTITVILILVALGIGAGVGIPVAQRVR